LLPPPGALRVRNPVKTVTRPMPRLKLLLQAIGLSACLLAGHTEARQGAGAPDPTVVRTA